MANQSTLTIGGIGGDPSGSRPIGNLNVNWTVSIDDAGLKYTANTIMDDVAAGTYHTDTTADYYSSELCVGTIDPSTTFVIGDLGNSQLKACWEYYKQSNNNNFNSGKEVVPGTAAELDSGTWVEIAAPAQDWGSQWMFPSDHLDEDLLGNGVTRLRVKMVALDAGGGSGGDGITHTILNAGIAVVNAAYVNSVPLDKQAKKNDTINNPVVFGGIGADPS
tara:strand:+ start:50 stop:709 length:660 start_codon:yes stop_codon:yes gene_type:complete